VLKRCEERNISPGSLPAQGANGVEQNKRSVESETE
jgi:hypothetical protein